MSFEATSLAEGYDRYAPFIGEAQNLCYLVSTLRKNDGVRTVRSVVADTMSVPIKLLLRTRNTIIREEVLEF